ncbi:response regulator [Candidatus Liberibacter africanus]|uniref:Putative two-component response regulator protein n=1 Tax=Candidatus Liberibacter africanus PTSAPSY TaxID=1277257 RepID=A0A0G3I9I1_LIBAF|nr:response regulator [Candidatus Liberibacter africanus]AKK20422.1 putative two-component response regulator protein [Candidatus Liberibacter africanus PTSAPSY]QTP64147.1 response regulator [Candidatus Liberibacter africanus]
MNSLVLVDSSHIVRKVGKRLFSDFGFEVFDASNVYEARELCKKESLPDYFVLDESLEGVLDFIADVRKMPLSSSVFIYYLLIEVDFEKMIAGAKAGVDSFLLKPFNRENIQFAMRESPQMQKIKDEN